MMRAEINDTIVWCRDMARWSAFLTDMFGLAPARPFYHFLVVNLDTPTMLYWWGE